MAEPGPPRCCRPKPGSGHCNICHEDMPSVELIDHVRVMHPDEYRPLERWPDGGAVVLEDDPSIADIEGSETDG